MKAVSIEYLSWLRVAEIEVFLFTRIHPDRNAPEMRQDDYIPQLDMEGTARMNGRVQYIRSSPE